MQKAAGQKQLIVKRISASQFEVCERDAEDEEPGTAGRQSVIRKAPPAANMVREAPPATKKRRSDAPEAAPGPPGLILIKDAITYKIVDILLWKVAGERRLRGLGYPLASTAQLLWRLLCHGSPAVAHLPQDHDCGENFACFSSHVSRFLETSVPHLWRRNGPSKFSLEDLLRKIYREDLIPYLRGLDLRSNGNALQCHSDIVLLEKWEKQKFTAVTWSGQKHFSRLPVSCPTCPQCSNRHL